MSWYLAPKQQEWLEKRTSTTSISSQQPSTSFHWYFCLISFYQSGLKCKKSKLGGARSRYGCGGSFKKTEVCQWGLFSSPCCRPSKKTRSKQRRLLIEIGKPILFTFLWSQHYSPTFWFLYSLQKIEHPYYWAYAKREWMNDCCRPE